MTRPRWPLWVFCAPAALVLAALIVHAGGQSAPLAGQAWSTWVEIVGPQKSQPRESLEIIPWLYPSFASQTFTPPVPATVFDKLSAFRARMRALIYQALNVEAGNIEQCPSGSFVALSEGECEWRPFSRNEDPSVASTIASTVPIPLRFFT